MGDKILLLFLIIATGTLNASSDVIFYDYGDPNVYFDSYLDGIQLKFRLIKKDDEISLNSLVVMPSKDEGG